MQNRDNRFLQAGNCQVRLLSMLRKLGFIATTIGQEVWLDKSIHSHIRHIHDDFTIALIRYFPDIFCLQDDIGAFLIQSKSTSPNYYDKPNFSIETASLDVDISLAKIGVRIIVVFENRPNEFYFDSVGRLKNKVHFYTTDTSQFQGSTTPMSLIAKVKLQKLTATFLEDIRSMVQ